MIRARLARLPAGFNGQVSVIYRHGCIERVEITESLKPAVDRTPVPIAKGA